MLNKMTPAFRKAEGGLFSAVAKADVGDAVTQLDGVTLMSWADPFYPSPATPPHVARAVIEAVESGVACHYTAPVGNRDLKMEIAKRLKAYNGLEVDPFRNILITPGSDAGLFYAMLPFIEKGDEVLIVDPSYPNNIQNTEIMGGVPVPVPVYPENGFQLDMAEFERRVTPRTKMVVLTNPNNPTTTVYRRDVLERLAEFIIRHDLVLVVDQAFEEPIFDGLEMVTMAALPGMWERTLTVFSLSKGMGLSGFRVGYLVADDKIMDKLFGCTVSVLGACNTASQLGAIAALRDSSFVEEYAKIHLRRRNMVYNALSGIPGVTIFRSESGFLSWVNVSALGTEAEVADYLLREARISVNVGTPYGAEGRGYIRIVHGVLGSEEDLQAVLERMRLALLKLGQEKGVA